MHPGKNLGPAPFFAARWPICHVVLTANLIQVWLAAELAGAATYVTNFPLAENPISQGGNWLNGLSVGLDFSNVAVSNGLAHGLQTGSNGYNDSTALLTGTWGSNQTVMATVHVGTRPACCGSNYIELELRLRSTLSPHYCSGYECNFSMAADGSGPYAQIVRWNGPVGDFTFLDAKDIHQIGEGTILSATIVGDTITTYTNGVKLASVSNLTYVQGNPGMGFYLQGTGTNDSGFTRYAATDGTGPPVIFGPWTTNGQFGFFVLNVPGQTYVVEENTKLAATNWTAVTSLTSTDSFCMFSTPVSNSPASRFFRLRVP
ncbi:MAG TPA: hypothetical protein VFF11_07335 [Candidatus Binatia bacterium]|nr:hypothetical protein [Candidatus Binatia bacterium]